MREKRYPGDILFVEEKTNWRDLEGLTYYPNYVSEEEAGRLKEIVESQKWVKQISRRQQHYGIIYYHTKHPLPLIQPVN